MGERTARLAVVRPLGMVIVFAALAIGCSVPVCANLDEAEANQVVVALDRAGLEVSKDVDPAVEGHYRVLVNRDEAGRALAILADEQLPRPRHHADGEERAQLLPSPAAEHAQIVRATAAELEATLDHVSGVLAARVHLDVPRPEPFLDGPPARATASVLIEHRGPTPPLAIESIQRLVAGSALALRPEDVAVVFVAHPSDARGGPVDALAHVGPIVVARGSVGTLKATLGALGAIVLTLAGALLVLSIRLTGLRRELTTSAASDEAGPPRGPRPRPPTTRTP